MTDNVTGDLTGDPTGRAGSPTNIAFPFHVDDRRRTATATVDEHVRDLVEQLVFTSPGERVNRPTFGAGLQQLVFAPNSPELAAALQFLVQGALQQYLGDLVDVSAVTVDALDSRLQVRISYQVRRTGQPGSTTFEVPT
ncbi:GPW/gp25 family protein [Intrasporangium sp.]|uniref:GPW/gp25 family protein n=1 Tax=Intrasporangium sp. TaxID=1925024 RepID=UPI00322164EC